MSSRKYTRVPGFFIHDAPPASNVTSTDTKSIPAIPLRFGLLDTSPNRWKTLFNKIDQLNAVAEPGTTYKFILFSRHGQGYHNVAEEKYGTQAWDDYWAMLNGDGEITWGPDPLLTTLGISQAQSIHAAWEAEIKDASIPIPSRRLCSPLKRAIRTAFESFDGLFNAEDAGEIVIKEMCREHNGEHTCDQRSTRTSIQTFLDSLPSESSIQPPNPSTNPKFVIEEGFSELDSSWTKTRESNESVAGRSRVVLDDIFSHRDGPSGSGEKVEKNFVSVTVHDGFIQGIMTVLGLKPWKIPTGGIFPVIIKAVAAPITVTS